jgi:hypothetical protein
MFRTKLFRVLSKITLKIGQIKTKSKHLKEKKFRIKKIQEHFKLVLNDCQRTLVKKFSKISVCENLL